MGPVIGLFILAPVIGEFLLGNLPVTMVWLLFILAPLYGGGALLIREVSRRLKLGWGGMLFLCLAYGILEEAFATQSLFNPNYLGLRLLDYGYIKGLGISAWWSVFVLTIHAVWSTAVPIALVESLTVRSRHEPWLGKGGLTLVALIFIAGCMVTNRFQEGFFMASWMQFLGAAVAIALLIVLALYSGPRSLSTKIKKGAVPAEALVAISTLVISSLFMGLTRTPGMIPAWLNVAGMIGLILVMIVFLNSWSVRAGWGERHRLAATGGLVLTYVWFGFLQVPSVGNISPTTDALGNALFSVCTLLVLFFAWKRAGKAGPVE